MDNYPDHLAPEFDVLGAVKTPFTEWWGRVGAFFSTVPEEVARYWLHEHWGHSPYSYLQSNRYQFGLEDWRATDLPNILSCRCGFDASNVGCKEDGAHLESLARPPYEYPTAIYMLENRTFPTPIVVLDNRDGHLTPPNVPADWRALPAGYVLVEGHRRFSLALHLGASGKLHRTLPVWLMTRI